MICFFFVLLLLLLFVFLWLGLLLGFIGLLLPLYFHRPFSQRIISFSVLSFTNPKCTYRCRVDACALSIGHLLLLNRQLYSLAYLVRYLAEDLKVMGSNLTVVFSQFSFFATFPFFLLQVRAKYGLCHSQRLQSIKVCHLILTISQYKWSMCKIIDRF